MASYNGTTETTTYLGGLVEKVQRGAVTEYRHYIPAGAGSMAIHTRRSGASPASSTYYVTGDHLGSATTVMDEAGATLANLSFAALGSRRRASWQDQPLAEEWAPITATTRRGFTGHEHLDNLSLIHMNGRVYDPKLGRFLSADPVWIGDPAAPQSLNPYSYVGNNPLSATDPSGLAPCMGNPGCDTVDDATMYVYGYVPDIVLVQIFIPEFGDVLGYWGDAPQMPSWHDLEAEAAEQESKPEIVVTATLEKPAPRKAELWPKPPPRKPCSMSGSDVLAFAGGSSSFVDAGVGVAAEIRNDAPRLVRGLGAAGGFVSAATAINGVVTGNAWDATLGTLDTLAFMASIVHPLSVAITGPYFLGRMAMELVMVAGGDGSSGGDCVP